MSEHKEKSAASTAMPTAEKEKIYNLNIAQTAEKIKCVVQIPKVLSGITELSISKESIGKGLEKMMLSNGLVLLMNKDRTANPEPNIRFHDGFITGTVAITATDDCGNFRSLTIQEIQNARAWLLKNSV